MKRVVKRPDVRRLEILKAASELFKEEGYSKTSVEAIIKRAGIAKGTFYHYFKAKKDILEALVEQVAADMEEYFNSIVSLQNVTAVEKLKLMISGPKKKKITSSPVMELIHKPENRELQERLNIKSVDVIAPLMAKIINEGKVAGIFPCAPSIESIQLLLGASEFILNSGLFIWSSKKQMAFLKALQQMLELLVGVKAGTFKFISGK